VRIWAEGYKDGEAIPERLAEISYGLNPNPVSEGPMGFGIMNPRLKNPLLFLYAPSVSSSPREVSDVLNSSEGLGSAWLYAIGEEEVGLKPGETKVLAVYRQFEERIRTYNYHDEEDIARMINEDTAVVMLKIQVELMDPPG